MYNRKWPYVVGTIVIAVLGVSLRPVHSLSSKPPQDFLQVKVGNHRNAEAWGRAYWQVARNVRWKFRYGEALPDDPPAEFRIAEEESLSPSLAAYVRSTYWYQLRTVWTSSEAWSTSYKLDFSWIPALIEALLSYVVEWFTGVRHRLPW